MRLRSGFIISDNISGPYVNDLVYLIMLSEISTFSYAFTLHVMQQQLFIHDLAWIAAETYDYRS